MDSIQQILTRILVGLIVFNSWNPTLARDYYYTRTRQDPNHLRVSEEYKNHYVDDIKYVSKINGTKYEYYRSSMETSHDQLVFETIDKMFRHRLSAFYIHHYDSEQDKRLSSDPNIVSEAACTRDLMYLVDKQPKSSHKDASHSTNQRHLEDNYLTPELAAFFDSYGRQEPGLMMGNIYWTGSYDQCVNRQIFELTGSRPPDMSSADNYNQDSDTKVISFKGRYCVAALKSPKWDDIISSKRQSDKDYFKSERQMSDYSKLFRLQVGICLPSSCDSRAFERHHDEIKLLTTNMLEQRYANYDLADLYCLPDPSSPLRAWSGSALYFLTFMSFWCAVLFFATIADVFDFVNTSSAPHQAGKRLRRKKLDLIVCWFSLRANYRKFMHVSVEHEKKEDCSTADAKDKPTNSKEEQNLTSSECKSSSSSEPNQKSTRAEITVNLRFLNAFKVIIMFWIVNGHIMLLMIETAKNILYSDALLNGLMHFLIGATFGVDLFFTMTGFLTTYLIFNSGHAYKMKFSTILYLSFHRYWRLAPMYLLTFWFTRSVVPLLGSGPLWDYGTSSVTFRGLCNSESWWYPLTLTSNLHGLFDECLITSWYISCDMQFWLVSPIFIYLLAKHPMSGWIASLASILMSAKMRYDVIINDKLARYDELVQPRADIFMRVSHDMPSIYTHPHYRIAAYIIGLLAGHYVYMVKSGKWRSPIVSYENEASTTAPTLVAQENSTKTGEKTSNGGPNGVRNFIAYGGLMLLIMMSFISYILANYFPDALLSHAKLIAAICYSIDHLAMAAGVSLLIISMCFGQWPSVVNFLSHPIWTRLSKLNYALLLLQCEAIYFQIFRYDQVPLAGTRELINILFNLLVTLYPVAFLVTLALEFPLANIEKLLF